MKTLGWLSVALVLTITIAAALTAAPTIASSFRTASAQAQPITAGTLSPNWNSGNLCSSIEYGTWMGHSVVNCTSNYPSGTPATPTSPAQPVYLWYNFSAGEQQGMIFNVIILSSVDCITMNFHSFYSWINIVLYGSAYTCAPVGGPDNSAVGSPGLNIAINSEGDSVSIMQYGSLYQTLVYVYGTTTSVNFSMLGSFLTSSVFFIGITPGFGTCPSGITVGRIVVHGISWGSRNTLNSIWVNGLNTAVVPPNVAYYTIHWWPINGGLGTKDKLGFEVTNTAPAAGCAYL